jgi:hypothetical protein
MLTKIWKKAALAIPMATLLFVSLSANAGTITGKLNGHECAHAGMSCPVDRLDPHIALESDFVLMVPGGDYYFLPNVSRDIKARHVLEDVQVIGDVNPKYRSIKVKELKVKSGSGFKTIWTQKMADFEMRALYGDGVAFPGQKQ